MIVDYSEDDWDEDDWVKADLEYDGLISHAAGEIGEAAQRSISEPDGLHKAFSNTLNSICLYSFSAFSKIAENKEYSGAMSRIRGVVAQSLVRTYR